MAEERVRTLEEQAIAYARAGDFGPAALACNEELVRLQPSNAGAWTRLARCHLACGTLDGAADAVDQALRLNPSNLIARNLRTEVVKARAFGRSTGSGAGIVDASAQVSGFGPSQFDALARLPGKEAAAALSGRFESLFSLINSQPAAARIVSIRARRGLGGSKLFHANSYYVAGDRHIFAYQHGGRWEPQFNLAMSAGRAPYENSFRIGIGFNLTLDGRTRDPEAAREELVRSFHGFQRALAGSWGSYLAKWMSENGGFLQYDAHPPALDWLPDRAVQWIVDCQDPVAQKWIFIGRWLFVDRDADLEILQDCSALAKLAATVFGDLLPIWQASFQVDL